MDIGWAIVISVAIISVCGMITILGVAGMKTGVKYMKYSEAGKAKKEKDTN